ncbi:MAG: phenol hydroxylase subunit [Halieaceae bacterium]|jgi:phenol hydroxylase P0 protein|nr:phenol hydroxylase subunit [Halieaceae bacterium]
MAPFDRSKLDPESVPVSELTRYVRIRREIGHKFIEFDFAIGDPTLYVELVLPRSAFTAFCHHNKVVMMTEEQADQVDADMAKWRYGEDTESPQQSS